MKRLFAYLFLLLSPISASIAEIPALEETPWPNPAPCELCVSVQISHLEMRWPASKLDKVLVLGVDSPSLFILPRHEGEVGFSENSIYIMATAHDHLTGRFQAKGFFKELGIESTEAFLDIVGDPNRDGESLKIMREIMQLTDAKRYTKVSKDNMHIYWIERDDDVDYLYVLINDHDQIYQVFWNGVETQELYSTFVSNMRYLPPP